MLILIIFKQKLNIIGNAFLNEMKYDLIFHVYLMKEKGIVCRKLISPEARIILFLLIEGRKD